MHSAPAIDAPSVSPAPDTRMRVFLYSHDTFGLGHFRRNLAIATRLLVHAGQFDVWLLTGSPVIDQWQLPRGLHVQRLPPVVKVGVESYAARNGDRVFGLVKGYREALILKLVLRHRPDVFLVDHAPAGMNGELLSTLALIRRELPGTRVMLGLRDILDGPENVRAIWAKQKIAELIEQAYDDVLVYGVKSMFDVVANYALSPTIADRLRYCGHVVEARTEPSQRDDARSSSVCWTKPKAGNRHVVLITAGGGGDGVFLMEAYLEALERLASLTLYSVLVLGPLMADSERARLRALGGGLPNVEFVDHVVNLVPSLRRADLVVSMAGYNTTAEIISNRKRAILVPRSAPRDEQRIRARILADQKLAQCVEPGPDLAGRLAVAISTAVSTPPAPPSLWQPYSLDGAERLCAYLLSLRAAQCERAP